MCDLVSLASPQNSQAMLEMFNQFLIKLLVDKLSTMASQEMNDTLGILP